MNPTTPNPFHPATPTRLYLKLGVFGDTGTGKTLLGLSADEIGKVCVVDAEGGTTAYRGIYNFDVINSQSYMELTKALTFLESGDHDYKTIMYDPATILYEAIQEARAKFRGKLGSEGDAGKLDISDWGAIKKIYKSLMIRLANLPMNVVLTFREKDKTDFTDINHPKYIGVIFDGEKSTPYYLDLWGRMVLTEKGDRVLVVKKSRFVELADQKIKIPMKGGFKKVLDLCEQARRKEGVGVKETEGAGSVQYTVDATDEDVPALKIPESKVAEPAKQELQPTEPAPPVANNATTEPKSKHDDELIATAKSEPDSPFIANDSSPALDRTAMKAQLRQTFDGATADSEGMKQLHGIFVEWCERNSQNPDTPYKNLSDADYCDFAEFAMKSVAPPPKKKWTPPKALAKGVLKAATKKDGKDIEID